MPRNDLTLSSKIDLLNEIKSVPFNRNLRQLSELTGVPKSTISRLIRQEDRLREEWELHRTQAGGTSKRKREGKDPDVEEALKRWFSIVTRSRSVAISGPILKKKSEEFAKMLGHNDFKATDGWLSRWKRRHNIEFKKTHGETANPDEDFTSSVLNGPAFAEQWKNTKIPIFLKNFSADNVYNANETGLYYRATPDGSLYYERVALGYDETMERITVLCCANMSGTDKKKLLVVGKNITSPCFKGLTTESLPVEYRANENAWMTSDFFMNWLSSWDVSLQQENRNILLIVDDCSAHRHLGNLKNIKLEYLLSKNTSLVQPMDTGITKKLKTLYREKLVNYILESIEKNTFTISSTAKDISSKISIVQAIHFVADSWQAITTGTIQSCFAACGFKRSEMQENSNDVESEVPFNVPIVNYQEFLAIDDNVACYEGDEDCVEAIVEAVQSNRQKLNEDNNDDKFALVCVTNQEAKKIITRLRHYFMQEGNEGSPISALNICADFVQKQSFKNKKQSKID